MTKQEMRKQIKEKRAMLEPHWVNETSELIEGVLSAIPSFQDARMVCSYLALPGEVRTDRLIERCWGSGKLTCVPAYCRKEKRYGLAMISLETELEIGHFDVFEPVHKEWVDPEKVDLMIVPGLVFDNQMGRIGHGGGHYDRMLKKTKKECFKVGLAFEFQMYESILVEDHDVKMDAVCTIKEMKGHIVR